MLTSESPCSTPADSPAANIPSRSASPSQPPGSSHAASEQGLTDPPNETSPDSGWKAFSSEHPVFVAPLLPSSRKPPAKPPASKAGHGKAGAGVPSMRSSPQQPPAKRQKPTEKQAEEVVFRGAENGRVAGKTDNVKRRAGGGKDAEKASAPANSLRGKAGRGRGRGRAAGGRGWGGRAAGGSPAGKKPAGVGREGLGGKAAGVDMAQKQLGDGNDDPYR